MSHAADAFLDAFHAARPGCTSRSFGQVEGGLSSYARLAAALPEGARRVLDLGCGDGFLLAALAEGRPELELAGLDRSPAELALAKARLAGRPVRLTQGVAEALPYPDASFDAVLSHLALMLMSELPQALAEVRRVLKPGGLLLAVVSGPSPKSEARAAFQAAWAALGPVADPHPPLGPTNLKGGDAAWRGWLEGAGFTGLRIAPFVVEFRRSPEELWALWADTYTVGALGPEQQAALRARHHAALEGQGDAEGRHALPWGLRWLRAEAPLA